MFLWNSPSPDLREMLRPRQVGAVRSERAATGLHRRQLVWIADQEVYTGFTDSPRILLLLVVPAGIEPATFRV